MQDKELVEKLNSLKDLRPDASWKKEARAVLLSQVSNSVGAEVRFGFFEITIDNFKNAFSFLPKAVWGIACLALVLTGGTFSVYAANSSKPGDNFYSARLLKEKIKLAMILNREDKARLDMKMATIRAKEISEVLASPNYKGDQKNAAKLVENFQQEINTVKERLSEIGNIQDKNYAASIPKPERVAVDGSAVDNDDKPVGLGDIKKESDGKVVAVESSKDSRGVQLFEPGAGSKVSLNAMKIPTTTVPGVVSGFKSSSTPATSTPAVIMNVGEEINITLDKAAESFNTKDFSGAKDIMEQVGSIIENIGSGEVKGVSEAGTSTSGGEISIGNAGTSSELK
jgi:hypothetical protein